MLTLDAKVEGKGNYTGFILPRRTKGGFLKICHLKMNCIGTFLFVNGNDRFLGSKRWCYEKMAHCSFQN